MSYSVRVFPVPEVSTTVSKPGLLTVDILEKLVGSNLTADLGTAPVLSAGNGVGATGRVLGFT